MIYRKEARILCPQYDRISMHVFLSLVTMSQNCQTIQGSLSFSYKSICNVFTSVKYCLLKMLKWYFFGTEDEICLSYDFHH